MYYTRVNHTMHHKKRSHLYQQPQHQHHPHQLATNLVGFGQKVRALMEALVNLRTTEKLVQEYLRFGHKKGLQVLWMEVATLIERRRGEGTIQVKYLLLLYHTIMSLHRSKITMYFLCYLLILINVIFVPTLL